MVARQYLPFLLAAVAACAQRPADTAPQPLVPKDGPKASVRVEYDGGIFNRRLSALFRTERPAYVMVAHLGGDGIIRVLFPHDARESGWVRGGRMYRTDMARGDYDAAPGFWFVRPIMQRSFGARTDSYDGNGHGFVFMIASSSPLRFDRVSEYGLWDEFELRGYERAFDPRDQIRQYANLVASAGRYTLDYASAFSSHSYASPSVASLDCALLLSGFGTSAIYYSDFLRAVGGGYFSPRSRGCRDSYFSHVFAFWPGGFRSGHPRFPVVTVPTQNPVTPVTAIPRPGRRDPLRPDRGGLNRPTFAQRADDVSRRRGVQSERRASPDRERVYPAPTTPRRGTLGGTRHGWSNPRADRTQPGRQQADSPRPTAAPEARPAAAPTRRPSSSPSPSTSAPSSSEITKRDP